MSIASRLNTIKKSIPEHVTLVAISKTKPVSDILEAYGAGQRIFGENKIQEMAAKYDELPKDIEWHMIGHVQSNKVKHMASFVSLVHGVDSLKLLEEINRHAKKHNRVIDCLLQLHIAEEETKFGMDENELAELLHSPEFKALENIKVSGLMGMATFTENQQQIKKEFDYLKSVFDRFSTENPEFKILSMGMSGDYDLAIECGSTMVRIGSSIFGERNYN
jgi:pyridoxal phosphate enzyme (YggS family)